MAKTYLDFFKEIAAIPHGSGNTKAISDYCASFAKQRGLRYLQDEANNVIIWKDATNGSDETVILQGHLDMVCVQKDGRNIDFTRDGLRLHTDGDFLFAEGTTLGGDDGIAVAYALAILDSDTLRHPNLEVVFTVDEEIGMLGAAALDLSPLKGNMLINVDSEEEGTLLTSCAGGVRADLTFSAAEEKAAAADCLRVVLDGLPGGHSGAEIDKGHENAVLVLAKLLQSCGVSRLCSIDGGSADNAIPTSCTAVVETAPGLADRLQAALAKAKGAFALTEQGAALTLQPAGAQRAFSEQDTARLLRLLCGVPNGIIAMSAQVPGLVQTSLNLGTVKTEGDRVMTGHALRSSVGAEKEQLLSDLTAHAAACGAAVSTFGDYPAWEFKENSRLRDTVLRCYERQYGKPMSITAIHAGLECGIFCGKKPALDCVSMGPDIFDIHTYDERLSLSSAECTYKLLCSVLEAL
ncbi:MAG: aminoacyl-histidine dipeptidase [Clostridia bacterium]|nr:aminoacyl-histidine dipeptidase [Clostridia bacterium]